MKNKLKSKLADIAVNITIVIGIILTLLSIGILITLGVIVLMSFVKDIGLKPFLISIGIISFIGFLIWGINYKTEEMDKEDEEIDREC